MNQGDFSRAVLSREKHICQDCGKQARVAHDSTGQHQDIDMGIALCDKCHTKYHSDAKIKENPKTQYIMVKVTPEEKAAYKAKADRAGMSLSVFIRYLGKQWDSKANHWQMPGKHTGEQSG